MLEIDAVTRTYADITAVDSVSFAVPAGAMVGFVGGNGAGKTTTMRIIMGILAPDSGSVRWRGQQLNPAIRSRIGYMPEERGLYPKQPLLEQLVYLARLHGMSQRQARERITALLQRFGLGDRRADKVETLSLGNQQRGQIIAAVLGEPVALVLDEPFSGLDPAAVDQMSALLREYTAAGVPVLFSSHQLDLVDRLCDSIVVLHDGKVVANGTSAELRETGQMRYRLTVGDDAGWVRGHGGVRVLDLDGPSAVVEIEAADEAIAQQLLREALGRGSVQEFSPVRPSLSEIYRGVAA
ncbi:MAG TPA: ATP-binding cassette domain-containing protein [Ornithinimicrobium sp.]|uniref:ABC transporter ATP-binding protein n=1 Tax=Ornithinimicrobium sp. TaxID=1977084 RepID=UPI002B48AC9C|nr:ATP-binding cassette domain-containing protein [Ornithinimicrobium sp.]HKJ11472.1 ATP-binding cassette domain-containing protein [Ornithinimicrobium sp.]